VAPLATAFVMVLPNMAGFAPAVIAGVAATQARVAAAGAAQGALYGTMFARSAGRMLAAGSILGLGLLVKEVVQAAGDFEAQMVRLTTSAGETGTLVSGNLKIVADGIKSMAGEVGYTATELGKAMYVVESAGFRAADGLTVLRSAAEAAKAENTDLGIVLDALTTVMIDYHAPADRAAEIMNKLLAAAASSKVNLQDMASSLHSVLPAASKAGVALEDILGALSAMTQHGFSARQATQNLADVIRHMQNPTNVQARELALLGLTTNQLAESLRSNGLTGTLQLIQQRISAMMPPGTQQVVLNLQTALSKLSPEVRKLGMELVNGSISFSDYRKAARDLEPIQNAQAMSFYNLAASTHRIGDEQMTGTKVLQTYGQALARATGDATGLNVALILTGANADRVNAIVDEIGAAALEAGGHVKGWAAIQETFNFRLAQTKAAFSVLAIALGESLLPVLGAIFKAMAPVVTAMAEFISANRTLSAIIMGSIGGYVLLGAAVLIVGRLAAGLRTLAVALRLAAIAQFLFLTPWGLIILAIGAVVAALVAAYFHFDGFRAVVDKVFRGAMVVIQLWWEYAQFVFNMLRDIIMEYVVPAVLWLWEKAFVPAGKGIVIAIQAWWVYAQFAFNAMRALIVNVVAPAVRWMAENVWGPMLRIVIALIREWWEYAQFAFGAIRGLVENVIAPVVRWMAENVWGPGLRAIIALIKMWWEYAQFAFGVIRGLIVDIVGPAIVWLWQNIFEPAITGIVAVLQVFWRVGVQVFDLVRGAIMVVVDIVLWWWHNVMEPAFSAIGFLIQAWWVIVQVIFQAVKATVETFIITPILYLWHFVMEPAWNAIRLAIALAWAIIKPIFDALGAAAGFLGDMFIALWRTKIEPAWNGIKLLIALGWEAIRPIFETLVDWITKKIPEAFRFGVDLAGKIFGGLKDTLMGVVNWVITNVINNGIIKAWNWLAEKFGIKDRIPNVPTIGGSSGGGGGGGGVPRAMREGGYLQGVGGPTQDNIPIMASAGEYVIPERVVRNLGVTFFDGLIGGSPRGSKQGSFGDSMGIGHYAVGGLIGDFIDVLIDPVSAIKKMVNLDIPGSGFVRNVMGGFASDLLNRLITWAKDKISSLFASSGPGGAGPGFPPWPSAHPGVTGAYGDSGVWRSIVALINSTGPISGAFGNAYRPGDPLWHGAGRAVDWMGFNQDRLAMFFMSMQSRLLEFIHRTNSRDYAVTRGVNKGSFNNQLMEEHRNHIHVAMRMGGMVPEVMTYDTGGPWPNNSIGINTSGRTEYVSSGDDMTELISQIRESNMLTRKLIAAVEGVGADVGAELTGVGTRVRQLARVR
jgi:hypothetical protein